MANPCRPFSRAAAMFSSGLETPSPEKKVWVCRSMLKAIAGRLVCDARNAKRRFQGMGAGVRGAGERRTDDSPAQRRHRRGTRWFWVPAFGVLSLPDVLPRARRESANAERGNPGSSPRGNRDPIFCEARSAKGSHVVVRGRSAGAVSYFAGIGGPGTL